LVQFQLTGDFQVSESSTDQVIIADRRIVDLASALQALQKNYDEDKRSRMMQKMQVDFLMEETVAFKMDLVEVSGKYDSLQEIYAALGKKHEDLVKKHEDVEKKHEDLEKKHEDLEKKYDTASLKLSTAESTIANLNKALGIQPPSRRTSIGTESKVLTRIANKHSAQDSKINTLSQFTQTQADKIKDMTQAFMQAKEENGKMARALVQVR
jgi:chromosome segregation ATPase